MSEKCEHKRSLTRPFNGRTGQVITVTVALALVSFGGGVAARHMASVGELRAADANLAHRIDSIEARLAGMADSVSATRGAVERLRDGRERDKLLLLAIAKELKVQVPDEFFRAD